MFVQMFRAKVSERDAVKRLSDRWQQELKPGAIGFLGSTVGVTDDGVLFGAARFESAAAAQQNSARPEQSAWFADLEQVLEGAVEFYESSDIEAYDARVSDDAGFVQISRGRVVDRAKASAMAASFMPMLEEHRPDLMGGYTAFHDDGTFTDVSYFRSEEEARAGEAKEMPADIAAAFASWQEAATIEEYIDLREPWLNS